MSEAVANVETPEEKQERTSLKRVLAPVLEALALIAVPYNSEDEAKDFTRLTNMGVEPEVIAGILKSKREKREKAKNGFNWEATGLQAVQILFDYVCDQERKKQAAAQKPAAAK